LRGKEGEKYFALLHETVQWNMECGFDDVQTCFRGLVWKESVFVVEHFAPLAFRFPFLLPLLCVSWKCDGDSKLAQVRGRIICLDAA